MDSPVIYQHPLAYLIGLEGISLLRGFSGTYDCAFTLARLREVQALLSSARGSRRDPSPHATATHSGRTPTTSRETR